MKTENKIKSFINKIIIDKDLNDNYKGYEISNYNVLEHNYHFYRIHFNDVIYFHQLQLLHKLKLHYHINYNTTSKKLLINIEVK